MFRFAISRIVVASVILATFFQSVAAANDGIVWQTDLKKAYHQAKAAKVPLVVYIYSEDENGLLKPCRDLEAGALSSRDIKFYRSDAVYVRVNSARDDETQSVSNFIRDLNVTRVPYVCICECRDDSIVAKLSITGDTPTQDFVRLLRRGMLDTVFNIKLQGGAGCTDAEYVRGVEAFRTDYHQLNQEFITAFQKRFELLNKLRDTGEFRVDEFQAADQNLSEIQRRIARRLMSFAELQSPEIREFCRAELEFQGELLDTATLLQEDLVALTVDGRLPGSFTVTLARLAVSQSERQFEKGLANCKESSENAGKKLDQRYKTLVQQRAVSLTKS